MTRVVACVECGERLIVSDDELIPVCHRCLSAGPRALSVMFLAACLIGVVVVFIIGAVVS